MKKQTVKKLLNKVRTDYNTYVQGFSRTRFKLRDDALALFEKYIQDSQKVLDVGCGNGRLLRALSGRNVQYFGIDNSVKLIEEAKKEFASDPSTLLGVDKWLVTSGSFQVADVLNLPFNNDKFDIVFCKAVLHHIPSQELQLKALQEMYRVLKPGGKLIMMNWNLSREVWKLKRIVTLLNCYIVTLLNYLITQLLDYSITKRKDYLGWRDLLIPWGITESKLKRYYHAFSLSELEGLVKESGFRLCEKYYTDRKKKSSFWQSFWKRGNMVVIATKK